MFLIQKENIIYINVFSQQLFLTDLILNELKVIIK